MNQSHGKDPIAAAPEIARLLDSICASGGFRRSPRLQRFLRYVVEHAIADPNQPLMELQIAMDVFDRNATFEPQIDPIVRVEAGRLRLRLTEYYAGPGQEDRVIIDISKGRYLPTFQVPTGKPQRSGKWDATPSARSLVIIVETCPVEFDMKYPVSMPCTVNAQLALAGDQITCRDQDQAG